MENLRCVVERITYQNPLNGYAVLKCRAKGYQDLVTVVGEMPQIHVGSVLILGGKWKIDAKYGRQFTVETFEETLPATVYGIEKYLGSGLIKGVGPKFAKRIVQTFGKDTLEVIEAEPDRLLEVTGIGQVRVDRIKKSWAEQKEIKNIMLFLQGHDVSTSHATRIFRAYGNESIQVVQENPYRLADEIWGIGFKTADTIAEKMGFGHEKFTRLRSGLLYTLNRLADEGHCYATRRMLLDKGVELLSVDESLLSMSLDEMIRVQDVITDVIPEERRQKQPDLTVDAGKAAQKDRTAAGQNGQQDRTAAGQNGQSGMAVAGQERNLQDLADDSRVTVTIEPIGPGSRLDVDTDEHRAIYLPPFFYAELGCAKRMYAIGSAAASLKIRTEGQERRLAQPPRYAGVAADQRMADMASGDRPAANSRQADRFQASDALIERIERRTGMTYDEVQRAAIREAVRSKILILTGGPGTGKTTTTLGIITAFREAGAKILLAAPTGRAAKRLSETTGMEAKTIHRLLEVKPPEGYQKNEENPLEGDVLIVDECSMIDIMLMYSLLRAVPDGMRLILVGDVDQLPSVGAGNVLRDIIESDVFSVIRLTRIFRQAMQSRIITNAHRINEGEFPNISNGHNTDFFFIEKEDPEAAVTEIVELVKNKLARYYRTPSEQIQVLTPMQRGVVGAANLNLRLQEAVNPGSDGLKRGGLLYRERDKVMQIRNNYDKEVFNGDIGVIDRIDYEDRTLAVRFDDRLVDYDATELDELVHAYATTIHKSQGSEYPIVVMPVLMNHFIMLQRNLVYTGVTRAKKILVIVGTKKALAYAVKNVTVTKRNTMLKERLRRIFERGQQGPEI